MLDNLSGGVVPVREELDRVAAVGLLGADVHARRGHACIPDVRRVLDPHHRPLLPRVYCAPPHLLLNEQAIIWAVARGRVAIVFIGIC